MKHKDDYIIGLDLGSTMLKGVLVDNGGAILSREKIEMEYSHSKKKHVEFNPDEMYEKVKTLIHKLSVKAKNKSKVAGICIASAAGSTILTDSLGAPICKAISWMDRRVNEEPEKLFKEEDIEATHEITGWPFSKSFPISQLAWIKTYNEEKIKKAAHICTSTDYICFKMTGKWGIDRSTATTTILQNQKKGNWYIPYLRTLGVDKKKLSPIYEVGTILGNVTDENLGMSECKVVLGAFDHSCAAIGAGIKQENQLMLSCGTSWVGFIPVKRRENIIKLGLLSDSFLQPTGPWGAMFSLPAVAGAINEIIEKHISNEENRFEILEQLASECKENLKGFAINPTKKQDAAEIKKHTKQEIARALMIGTAEAVKEKIEMMNSVGVYPKDIVMVGGPSESSIWRKIIGEVLNMPVQTAYGSWTGAVGAAILGKRSLIKKDI